MKYSKEYFIGKDVSGNSPEENFLKTETTKSLYFRDELLKKLEKTTEYTYLGEVVYCLEKKEDDHFIDVEVLKTTYSVDKDGVVKSSLRTISTSLYAKEAELVSKHASWSPYDGDCDEQFNVFLYRFPDGYEYKTPSPLKMDYVFYFDRFKADIRDLQDGQRIM